MNSNKRYLNNSPRKQLIIFLLLFSLILLSGCGGGGNRTPPTGSSGTTGGSTSGPLDTISPTVTTMTPTEDISGVNTNSKLAVTFSEAMESSAINTENFRLTDGTNAIPGTVTYDAVNRIAVFTPDFELVPFQRYTATIITGIKDMGNNPLTTDFAWCFVAGGAADNTVPEVVQIVPGNSATAVPINQKIGITFSEEMDASTLTSITFTVTGPGATPVLGTVSYINKKTVFKPAADFQSNTEYVATISNGVRDLAGNAATSVTWSFATGASRDTTAPTAIATNPASAASDVAITGPITVTFSESIDPTTITTENFTVTGPGSTPVIGTVAYNTASNSAVFTRILHLTTPVEFHPIPVSNLDADTTYTVSLSSGIKDMAGNALEKALVWAFKTAPMP